MRGHFFAQFLTLIAMSNCAAIALTRQTRKQAHPDFRVCERSQSWHHLACYMGSSVVLARLSVIYFFRQNLNQPRHLEKKQNIFLRSDGAAFAVLRVRAFYKD